MLELQQLFLLFEVVHDLLQRFLQDNDLLLQDFDLLLLHHASRFVLVLGFLLEHQVSLLVLRDVVQLCLLSLVVVESVPLAHRFLGQLLVLVMDGLLDFLYVPLGIQLGLGFVLLQRILELDLHFLLHSRLLDFDTVPLLLNRLLQTSAVLLPSHELQLVLQLLLADVLHLVHILMQLRDPDLGLFNLLLGLIAQLLDLILKVVGGVRLLLLILFLQVLDFVVQLDHPLHAGVVVLRQPQDNVVAISTLLLELVL